MRKTDPCALNALDRSLGRRKVRFDRSGRYDFRNVHDDALLGQGEAE